MFPDDAAVSDAELVRLAQAGDRLAFATLFQRHRGLAMSMCRRVLGSTDGVEDALQEAALHVLLSWDRLRRPDRFGAWFVGIAIHMCHRMLRSRPADEWSLEALDGGRSVPELLYAGATVDDIVQVTEVVQRVRAAVAELPPGQRAAVLLVYLGGFTQTEVADLLGIRTGAVKTRLHKARTRLKSDTLGIWEDFMTDETPAPAANGQLLVARVTDVRRDADGQLWVILREASSGREQWLATKRSLEADALAVALQGQRLPGWLYDELVREPAETALVREAPDTAPQWVDGALCSVRLMLRDDQLVGVLDVVGDDGQSTGAVDEVLKALLRAQVNGVPLQIEEQALHTSSRATTAAVASDPFGPRSIGASQLADEVFARWQRWRTEGPDWVPMRVADVFARGPDAAGHYRHVVMLREVDGGRYLPIWVGQSEGAGLAVLLAGVETPRPFSVVLMGRLLTAAGGNVREVRINRLFDQTFYAEIVVQGANGEQTLDARPSDALAVALHTGAPVSVAAAVLELAADQDVQLPDPLAATKISEAILATWTSSRRLKSTV